MASRAAAFGGAAVFVERVKFVSEVEGDIGIAGDEEVDNVGGDVHAAGGIDAGGKAGSRLRQWWERGRGEFGDLHESAEAGLDGVGDGR